MPHGVHALIVVDEKNYALQMNMLAMSYVRIDRQHTDHMLHTTLAF
jgi:hypothetical protein